MNISANDYSKIGLIIKERLFRPAQLFKQSIFLCGADKKDDNTSRSKIARLFEDDLHSYRYEVIYPEDLFDELLYSHKYGNLLTLENLLADSVDVICIILESAGAIAELGAFTNDQKLRGKIICLVEEKFKKEKSFIAKGPLMLLKGVNAGSVIYYEKDNLKIAFKTLKSRLNQIKKDYKKEITLLQLDSFLLPVIYLFEPVTKDVLSKFTLGIIGDEGIALPATIAALTVLTKKRLVGLTPHGYKITDLGIKQLSTFRKKGSANKNYTETKIFDSLRLEILNLQFRNKKLAIKESSF